MNFISSEAEYLNQMQGKMWPALMQKRARRSSPRLPRFNALRRVHQMSMPRSFTPEEMLRDKGMPNNLEPDLITMEDAQEAFIIEEEADKIECYVCSEVVSPTLIKTWEDVDEYICEAAEIESGVSVGAAICRGCKQRIIDRADEIYGELVRERREADPEHWYRY